MGLRPPRVLVALVIVAAAAVVEGSMAVCMAAAAAIIANNNQSGRGEGGKRDTGKVRCVTFNKQQETIGPLACLRLQLPSILRGTIFVEKYPAGADGA